MADQGNDKSVVDQAKDKLSEMADMVSTALQPGDSKSTTQQLSESTGSAAQKTENTGKSVLQSAQETVSKALGTDASSENK